MNSNNRDDDTVEIPGTPFPPTAHWSETGSARVEVDLAAVSHPGLVRENNEDHYLVVRLGRWLETLLTNLPADKTPVRVEEIGYGLIVADGMGGTDGGEVASQMAITTLVSLALHTPDWILGINHEDTQQRMQRMAERWRGIQETLYEMGRRDPTLGRMGTTMSAAVSLGARLVIGHVGDSRIYLFRDGQLHQLTRDHTLVQSMVDIGQLTPEQAARHPRRHVLMHSFSAAGDAVSGDFQQTTLANGDQLLLCTDGLTDMVNNAAIGAALSGAASADEACQVLLASALKNGGKDNITVALARYRIPQ